MESCELEKCLAVCFPYIFSHYSYETFVVDFLFFLFWSKCTKLWSVFSISFKLSVLKYSLNMLQIIIDDGPIHAWRISIIKASANVFKYTLPYNIRINGITPKSVKNLQQNLETENINFSSSTISTHPLVNLWNVIIAGFL